MVACAVSTCKRRSNTSSYSRNGISFHIFPQITSIKKKWIAFCRKNSSWTPTRTSVICSEHFEEDSYRTRNNRRQLIEFAVPTLLNAHNCNSTNVAVCPTQDENMTHPQDTQMQLMCVSPLPSTSQSEVKLQGSVPYCQNTERTSVLQELNSNNQFEQPQLSDTPKKRKMKSQLIIKNKKIRALQAKTRYLKKKINTLQDLLNDLCKKSLIDKEERSILEKIGVEQGELLKRELRKSESGNILRTKYSPELRCFALTLNYYSPKAYKYVRKTFGTCLPHPRTLSKWYSTIGGQPGFTEEALKTLKMKAEDSSEKIYVALIFDEMKIKQFTEWDPKTQRYFGFVNHGFDHITDNSEEATDALVFLLVGINKIFKIPIGFFLIRGMNGIKKAQLVNNALALIHETGVEVKSLTCDGTKANLAMAEELGCSLEPDQLRTTILDASSGQMIHFFLDPCHMIKLIRNSFNHYNTLHYNSSEIKWSYIENLHEIQEKELFYMANKLRANHIHFKSKIMSVKLATQLFSSSVADALIFCQNILKIPNFEGAHTTATFIKLMNDIFDILDSRTKQYGLKRALNIENYKEAFEKLNEGRELLTKLFVDIFKINSATRVNILKSPRYTGFLGILVCIASAKSLFEDLVINDKLKYLPMHKISQDHIEILFSVIRSRGGYSDNPTARQFESNYKKILIHSELQPVSSGANCTPLEKFVILNCSSAVEKINNTTSTLLSDTSLDLFNEIEILDDIEAQSYLSPFGEKVLEYISGFVVYSIKKTIKCATCIEGLLGPPNEHSLTYQKSRGYLMYASKDVINLCRECEIEIRRNLDDNKKLKPAITPEFIISKTLKKFVGKPFFPFIETHVFDNDFINHNMQLAMLVMQKYTNTRISFLMKKSDPKKCIRHIYSKLIHFKNQ